MFNWLPDESLYSLVLRFGMLSGHQWLAQTTQELFGTRAPSTAYELVGRLDRLEARLAGQLGTAGEILRQRTTLPAYLLFSEPVHRNRAIEIVLGHKVGDARRWLRLDPPGQTEPRSGRRVCRSCLAQDVTDGRVSYWHLSHQIPGVLVCRAHDEMLLGSAHASTPITSPRDLMPSRVSLRSPTNTADQPGRGMVNRCRELADVANGFWEMGRDEILSGSHIFRACWGGLMKMELASVDRGIDMAAAASRLVDYCRPLVGISELSWLPRDETSAKTWIQQLVVAGRAGAHPVRYAVMLAWLFGDWAAAVAEIRRVQAEMDVPEVPLTQPPRRGRISELPRAAIIDALKDGRPAQEVWTQLGVRRGSVERLLRSVPGLSAEHQVARRERAVGLRRIAWEQVESQYPTLSIATLRCIDRATYAWLNENDHEWIRDRERNRAAMGGGVPTRESWLADQALASKIQRAGPRILNSCVHQRERCTALFKEVDGLQEGLRSLTSLQATEVAIRRVLGGRQSAYGSRAMDFLGE